RAESHGGVAGKCVVDQRSRKRSALAVSPLLRHRLELGHVARPYSESSVAANSWTSIRRSRRSAGNQARIRSRRILLSVLRTPPAARAGVLSTGAARMRRFTADRRRRR